MIRSSFEKAMRLVLELRKLLGSQRWFGLGGVACSGLRLAWGNSEKCPNNDDAHASILSLDTIDFRHRVCGEILAIRTRNPFALSKCPIVSCRVVLQGCMNLCRFVVHQRNLRLNPAVNTEAWFLSPPDWLGAYLSTLILYLSLL